MKESPGVAKGGLCPPWVFVPLVLLLAFRTSYGFSIDRIVENAVLKGNWQEIVDLLKKRDANDPVERLLMGHAGLATNRNNAAQLLFFSVKSEKGFKTWSAWTDALSRKHPHNPISLYLSADANARTGRFSQAIKMLTEGIQLKPDFALALTARGVIRVLTNEWDLALSDFLLATQAAPELAEAHASLGTYWILREGPEGALEAFNQALAINPDFALAYNGRGCAYFGQGEFEKAAQDFRMASQLSPMVALTEVNQGFASAYASRLITLANIEQKPGMSLESLSQQHQAQFQTRQQELVKSIPDQTFWNKMRAFDRLPATEQKSFINTHGLANVQTALSHIIADEALQVQIGHQEVLNQNLAIGAVAERRFGLGVLKQFVSVTLTGIGTATGLYKAGTLENWLRGTGPLRTEMAVDRALLSGAIENRTAKKVIDAIPSSLSLPGVASAAVKVWINRGDVRLADKLEGHMTLQATALEHQLVHSRRLQGLLNAYPRSAEIGATEALSRPSSSIAGYYISQNRPLTDLGSLASMLNKQISPGTGGVPRNALIVDQEPFRTSLLQSELGKYGFQTTAISPGDDTQRMANQWRSDVIVGIQASDLLRRPQYPPFPPGGGGGGAAAGTRIVDPLPVLPKKFDQWSWGKPFIPTSPQMMPGGISTKELVRAFVDKGNWPVLTAFGLFYTVAPELLAQK